MSPHHDFLPNFHHDSCRGSSVSFSCFLVISFRRQRRRSARLFTSIQIRLPPNIGSPDRSYSPCFRLGLDSIRPTLGVWLWGMEAKSTGRFTLGKQSSLAPDRDDGELQALRSGDLDGLQVPEEVDANIRLMYLANEGDLAGIEETLASGVDVNFRDIDDRTALHVAACQGFADVVQLLLDRGAQVDPEDRWGSTVRDTVSSSVSLLWINYCFFLIFYGLLVGRLIYESWSLLGFLIVAKMTKLDLHTCASCILAELVAAPKFVLVKN